MAKGTLRFGLMADRDGIDDHVCRDRGKQVNLAIVPVRVSIAMTKACIASLQAQDMPCTILAIDNGSTDGCSQYLRSTGVELITYPRPIGLSRLWNNALSMAFDQMKLPYVMVLNNDTVLRKDTMRWLVADGGPFVTGIGVSSMEQTKTTDATSRRPHPDYSCWLMRREVWDKVGGFDESMVTWASDCDHHVRMHQAGIDAHCIGVPFFHIASGTMKNADDDTRDALQKQADQDRETFKAKWGMYPGTSEYNALFTTPALHVNSPAAGK